MKFSCISDTHLQAPGVYEKLIDTNADVLIHTGDAMNHGDAWELDKLQQWFEYYVDSFDRVLFIPGNHDLFFEDADPGEISDQISAMADYGVEVLINKAIDIDGIKIYGTPYMAYFCGWAFMRYEMDLKDIYAKIPDDTQVLLTHGPAFGHLDLSLRGDICGSPALTDRKRNLKDLKYHVFGHIHHSRGVQDCDGVTCINAAALDDRYSTWEDGRPIYFEI